MRHSIFFWRTDETIRPDVNPVLLRDELFFQLSCDVVVIQWITSCHKYHINTTCNNTSARTCNVIDNVRVNNAFSY